MSQENQSCLRFSLEESLWFRKGQEVEELISISLDPDITIQENDQYVTIRGSLELSGEYKSYEASVESEEQEPVSQKFVERVAEGEEGSCEFSHYFPVDITIPTNRIQSIYDIDVLVETFDYTLPERSCLKLSAELTITGLYGSEQQDAESPVYEVLHRSEPEEELEAEETAIPVAVESDYLFEVEARKQQKEDHPAALPVFPAFNYQLLEEESEAESKDVSYQPLGELQEIRNEGTPQSGVKVEIETEVAAVQVPAAELEVEVEVEHVEAAAKEESSSSSEEILAKVKKKLAGKKKSMTLTEFFARKDESTAQVKVKVCIVQKGDTVNSIADRYDVSVQNLLRVNRLEVNQDVHEGQALYIPVAMAKK